MIKRSFLSRDYNFQISKTALLWSFILGNFVAISCYAYLCFLRLFLRILDNQYQLQAVVFNESERLTQNWYFAILSLVIGNSFFIACIFRRTKIINLGIRKHTIVSQQFILSVSFIHLPFLRSSCATFR